MQGPETVTQVEHGRCRKRVHVPAMCQEMDGITQGAGGGFSSVSGQLPQGDRSFLSAGDGPAQRQVFSKPHLVKAKPVCRRTTETRVWITCALHAVTSHLRSESRGTPRRGSQFPKAPWLLLREQVWRQRGPSWVCSQSVVRTYWGSGARCERIGFNTYFQGEANEICW